MAPRAGVGNALFSFCVELMQFTMAGLVEAVHVTLRQAQGRISYTVYSTNPVRFFSTQSQLISTPSPGP